LNIEPTVRMDPENEPQPDACLRIATGGQSWLTADDYLEGAPELLVEIAASSVSKDLHDKKRVYGRNRVQEYLVWRVLDRQVDWFFWREGDYELLPPDADGIYRSQVFPGLWLDATALLRGDLAHLVTVLQQGLNSPEHTAFIQSL